MKKKPEDAEDLIGYIPQENFSSLILADKENLMYARKLISNSKVITPELVF